VAITGISVGVLAGLLFLLFFVHIKYYLKKKEIKKTWEKNLILDDSKMHSAQIDTNITSIMVEKSEEFSYKELSIATNNFSMANKIGEDGFGEVFYAELRGQVCYHMHVLNYIYILTCMILKVNKHL
jgi:chitin elicitor receptor kinase 1